LSGVITVIICNLGIRWRLLSKGAGASRYSPFTQEQSAPLRVEQETWMPCRRGKSLTPAEKRTTICRKWWKLQRNSAWPYEKQTPGFPNVWTTEQRFFSDSSDFY